MKTNSKAKKDNKIILIVSIAILVILLIVLLVSIINGNKKESKNEYRTLVCTQTIDDGTSKTDSKVTLEVKNNLALTLVLETTSVFNNNEYLMNFAYQEEQDNIDVISALPGIKAAVAENTEESQIKTSVTIEYLDLKVPEDITLENPYKALVQEYLTKNEILEFLNKEGYTCE